jgi:hypothetical protein
LSTFYKGIIDPPNLVTVEEPEAASGTVFAIDPLDTMLTTQLVSHGKSGHYRITPVSDLNVPNIGGTCGVGAYFEDSDFPGSYRYITEPITSPCTVEIRFAPKPPPPPPPTAVEDEFEAQEDSILTVSFPGVFQNDTYDNSTFVAAIGGGGEGGTLFGTLDFRTNGTFTYEPDINLCNTTDSFDYIILNGINFSGVVSVSIPITCVNDPPVITALPDVSIDLNSGPQSIDSFATAAPGGGADEIGQTFTWNIHEVTNGELFLTKPAIDGTGRLTYSLMPNISGTFTVTVTVTDSGDGNNTSAAQTFDIVVLPSIEIPTLPLSGLVLLVMLLGWFAVDVLRRRERSA